MKTVDITIILCVVVHDCVFRLSECKPFDKHGKKEENFKKTCFFFSERLHHKTMSFGFLLSK